jgi:hypothetical protein
MEEQLVEMKVQQRMMLNELVKLNENFSKIFGSIVQPAEEK